MRLLKVRNEVVNDLGEIKRYTNFYLEVSINSVLKRIPINPVNYGDKNNRVNYSALSLIAEDITPKKDVEGNVIVDSVKADDVPF